MFFKSVHFSTLYRRLQYYWHVNYNNLIFSQVNYEYIRRLFASRGISIQDYPSLWQKTHFDAFHGSQNASRDISFMCNAMTAFCWLSTFLRSLNFEPVNLSRVPKCPVLFFPVTYDDTTDFMWLIESRGVYFSVVSAGWSRCGRLFVGRPPRCCCRWAQRLVVDLLYWLPLCWSTCRLPWQPLHHDVTPLPGVRYAAAAAASQTSHLVHADSDLRTRATFQTTSLPVGARTRTSRVGRRTFSHAGTMLYVSTARYRVPLKP